ncbi:MAG: transcription antitermination factor NusB, partial [Candidatus Caenarcaniphilales bacterium]|nr:transcription antitermination factor NusB [Candidatus Caenarcaniphilales bacterium]
LSHISNNETTSPDKLILASTRTLRDFAKQKLKQVQKELSYLGEFFFNENLSAKEPKYVLDLNKIHDQVSKLEEATFSILEALELPELLNHSEEAFDFARKLVDAFRSNKDEINGIITEVLEAKKQLADSKGWNFERVLSVDRTVLKVATTELLFFKDCPGVVVIDEAIKLGEKYGSDDSPKFINGVLADIVEKINPLKSPINLPENTNESIPEQQ